MSKYELMYRDGTMRGMRKGNNPDQLIKWAQGQGGINQWELFRAESGFHSTTQDEYLVHWWDAKGNSYWSNRAKSEPELMQKRYGDGGVNENEVLAEELSQGDYAYRIFDSKGDKYMSLFHGTKGSRTIPVGKWVEADVMQVYNPGSRSVNTKPFKSGWHVTPSYEEAVGYLTKFRSAQSQNYVLAKVQVAGEIRKKPSSRANVWLAEKMKIVEILGRPTEEYVVESNAIEFELMDISPMDDENVREGKIMSKKLSLMEAYGHLNKKSPNKQTIKEDKKVKETSIDFTEIRKTLTENLHRLENVEHNRHKKVEHKFNGFSTKETSIIAESLLSNEQLVESARTFLGSYDGIQPYRDFMQTVGMSTYRTRGVEWISKNINYEELNKVMRQLRDK